jgi:site-specific recombinase
MIVKITYSTDLEDVPMEVSKILGSTKSLFTALDKSIGIACQELSDETTKEDVRTSMVKIEQCIKTIEKLDAKLKDCYSILNGYTTMKEKEKKDG